MSDQPNVRLKIKSIYDSLSPKEQIIADYVLKNPDIVAQSSISDLSSVLNLAISTFFQFTKKLGYSGFKDFKMALWVQENNSYSSTIHENIDADDEELVMAQKVFDSNIKSLNETKKLLQAEDFIQASKLIQESNQVYFFGIGGSAIVAYDAYHKFLRSSASVNQNMEYHIQLIQASLMTEKDVAICISHTGRTHQTIEIAQTAKEAGAKIIVITSNASSPLAKLGDIVFISLSEEIEFHPETLSARISQLSILDSLFVILMFHNGDKSRGSLQKVRHVISKQK